jgi:two-component system, response regulator PdtaR
MAHTILVAEDDYISGVDLCDTCEEAGYHVEGPHTGISSVMLACQKGKPDLAILDVKLDDGTVFELAQTLSDEDVPIIFHAGDDFFAEVTARFPRAITLGKPCPPAQFLDTIGRVLRPA